MNEGWELKSYASQQHFRLVGKVWEIKRYLNQMTQQKSGALTLAEYLSAQLTYSTKASIKPVLPQSHMNETPVIDR
jgi:hypothetical protein